MALTDIHSASTADAPTPQVDHVDRPAWQERLEHSTLVATGSVVKELNTVLQSEGASARELADVIKSDASLAARVLKVANGAILSRGERPLSLNEAVVKLGVKGLKSICLSLVLLDTLNRRPEIQRRMQDSLSQAFHAGVQAKIFCGSDDEDIFIAALLRNIGELLFWSSSLSGSEGLCKRVNAGEISSNEAVEGLLGTDFDQIGLYFAEQWQLSDLLISSYSNDEGCDKRVAGILHADRVAKALAQGWRSEAFREVIVSIARERGISFGDLIKEIKQGVSEAGGVARQLAAPAIIELLQAKESDLDDFIALLLEDKGLSGSGDGSEAIASVDELKNTPAKDEHDGIELVSLADSARARQTQTREIDGPRKGALDFADDNPAQSHSPALEGPHTSAESSGVQQDLPLQMQVLDDLWKMVERGDDINKIFTMMCKGMQASLGVERLAIALTSSDRLKLAAKYIAGQGCETWTTKFHFVIDNPQSNLLAYCLHQGEPLVIHAHDGTRTSLLLTDKFKQRVGECAELMVAPIFSGKRAVAVFYADRGDTEHTLSSSQYQSFCRFSQQVSTALTMLANKRKGA